MKVMIDHIIVDKLSPNDLAIYDVDSQNCDIVYNFNPGNQDVERQGIYRRIYEGHYWQNSIPYCNKFFINLNIDIFIEDMLPLVEEWLSVPHTLNPDVPGTLYVAIHGIDYLPQEGELFKGGFGFVPRPYGIPLDGLCPIEVVKQIISVSTPAKIRDCDPVIRSLISDYSESRCINALNTEWEWTYRNKRDESANERARMLLYNCLSINQISDLEEDGFFTCKGSDGKTYRIENTPQHNVFLMHGDRKVKEFCIVTSSYVPIFDLMLIQKFMIESNIEGFYKQANRWDLLVPEKKLEYLAPPLNRPELILRANNC